MEINEKTEDTNHQLSSTHLDKRLLELTSLFEISRSLNSMLNLRSILENVLRIPMGHLLVSRGIILLKKEEASHEFFVEEIKGLPRDLLNKSIQIPSPPQRSMTLDEIETGMEWLEFFREFNIQLLVPLNSSTGTKGLLGFGKKIGQEKYEETEIEFLDSLSNIATNAVVNGMMFEEIQSVNRILDRKVQQLNTIFDISREFNLTLDCKKIGSLLSFALMGEMLVNRCMVIIKNQGKLEILVAKGSGLSGSVPDCIEEVTQTVILDETEPECLPELKSMGFALMVPMHIQNKTRGLMILGPKISGEGFGSEEIEFLQILGNQAMASLENARLFDEALEKQKMEEELHLAQKIQQGLLLSTVPGIMGYEIATINLPSRQVGGDYYDIIPISEGRYGITIADVVGKGAGAALLMANLQASLRALLSLQIPIDTLVSRINHIIYENTDLDKFITFFYGELDPVNQQFTFCNAGHNPPYRVSKKCKLEELTTGGIVIGMMPDALFDIETIQLNGGDQLVFYTDGVTETVNKDDEEFGEDRLKNLIKDHINLSAEKMIEKIIQEVKQFGSTEQQIDDITLVTIKVK